MYSAVTETNPELVETLPVDRTDPMFFDHPLDHIPGMLLLSRAMSRVVRDAGPDARRTAGRFAFHRFAEFSPDVETRWVPEAGGTWVSETVQDGTVLADGRFTLTADAVPDSATDGPPDGAEPAPRVPAHGDLVHRCRSENVLLGRPAEDDELVRVALLDPPVRHHFRDRAPDERGAEEIVEAARQFGTLLWNTDPATKPGAQLVLNAMEFDVPLSVPRSVPAELHWRRHDVKGSRWRLQFDVIAGNRVAGTAGIDFRGVSPTAYRRLRGLDD